MKFIMIYFVLINVFVFCLYGIDKIKAQKHKWRISENTLLLFTFLGGSLGAIIAMNYFHHKTKHYKFKLCVPLCLIFHMILLFNIYHKIS